MDFRKLNSYLEAWCFDFPGTVATVKRTPARWNIYSSIDLFNGYFHIPINDQLQRLFCFVLGRWRFANQTLPQEWASRACLFHSKISSLLVGFPCVSYVNDILVKGRDKREHDANLGLVLERLNSMNLHVSKEKVQHAKEQILFMGYDVQCGGYGLDTYISE